jgi:hypothetical protein
VPLPRAGSFGFNTKKSAELDEALGVSRCASEIDDRVVARIAGLDREDHRARDLLVGPREAEGLPAKEVRVCPDRDPDNARPRRLGRGENSQQTKRPEDQSLHGASGYRRPGAGRL